jgi:FkbM family methyltransferase
MLNLDLLLIRIRKLLVLVVTPFFLRTYLKHGVVPAIEHLTILRSLPFDFVADVGANRGQFSLVCRWLKPDAVIVAFEPLVEPAAIYRAVFESDTAVALHPCALGCQRGEVTMNIAGRDDSSSLLPISDIQIRNFPGTGKISAQTVSIGLLSDFVRHADMGKRNLLKIDVQGFELEVLKSADTLLPWFDWIYAECSFVPLYEGQALAEEIIAWLADHSFILAGQFNPSHASTDGALLQADLLFKNRERP